MQREKQKNMMQNWLGEEKKKHEQYRKLTENKVEIDTHTQKETKRSRMPELTAIFGETEKVKKDREAEEERKLKDRVEKQKRKERIDRLREKFEKEPEKRVLAHPCNPATWRSRSVTRRMSCLVHRLVSKSCLIITHPVALPPKYCVGSVGRIASGKVVVIRHLQPSGIL